MLVASSSTTGVIRDPAALDALKDSWDALAAACPNPTQQHDWLCAAADTFCDGGRLHVVTVVRDGRLVAAAPLSETPSGDFELLGLPQMYEFGDLLYEDGEALRTLSGMLARDGVPLLIRRLPEDSPTIPALTRAYALRAVTAVRPAPATPTLALGPAWTGPEGALSSRRRSDLRRARRRAQALGDLAVELHAPGLGEVDPLLDEAIAVDAASWRAGAGTALGCDASRGAFLRSYARRSAADGRLRVGLLRIDGTAAAMQIAVELDERLWLLKIGFDRRFAACSPGALLLLESLRDAAARGLRACELMGSVEPWTSLWTGDARPLVGLRVRPLSVRALRGAGARVRRKARGTRNGEATP